MSNDLPEVNGHEAAASPAKRQKLAHHRDPHRQPRASRIFAPFRTLGLVSPTSVPFTSIPLGKTTFQITTTVGRCLHTYDLRRGLNLVFISRPQTPAPITATLAWKERVLAAWGGGKIHGEIGVWVFLRGKQCGVLEIPPGLIEPIKEITLFGSWIVARCSTRIEVWKSDKYEHYTTITPVVSQNSATGDTLSGGICHMPTFLNKILVGKKDGSVDIWNVSTGKLVYTILSSHLTSGAVTALQATPALALVAIARANGSITIQDIRKDKTIMRLDAHNVHAANITSISFRTDGHGAGVDGQEPGVMATAGTDSSDITLWDLNNEGRVAGILHGAHNPPSSAHKELSVSGGISKVEFLPGQNVMVTSGLDNALKSWIFDASSFSAVPRILHCRSGHAAPITKLAFMPTNSEDADATGKWILSAGRDQSLWGWSIRRDGQSSELSQGPVRKKAKKLGFSLEVDGSVSLEELKAPEITCFACSLNRDGGMGAAPGAGGIWANAASKKGNTDTSENGLTGWESIVTGHRGDKYARTWFWGRKRAGRWAFETADSTEVSSVAVSSCGTFALVASTGGSISMFNLQSGILRQRFPAPLTPAQVKRLKLARLDAVEYHEGPPRFGAGEGRHRKAVSGLMVDPLNRTVISCGLDGKIKFWDFQTGMLRDEIDWSPMVAITASQYYRASDLVALSCDDLSIRIIDVETKKLVRELWGCLGQISDFCFSNDGRWIVAASMDSVIRIWDLPTSHLINAFRVESPCTALAFSETGEYLATAHADSVGINLWNNRTLFTHVPTRMIKEDEIIEATLPTTSGENGQGLLNAAFEQSDVESEEDEDFFAENQASAINTLSNDLLTLSLVPKARWQTLLHLSEIKARNKPIEPPKAHEKAPFFLPSLTSGDSTRQSKPLVNDTTDAKQLSNPSNALSRISRPSLASSSRSQFTILLHTFATTVSPQQQEDPEPLVSHLATLAPAAADTEIRSLANLDEMTAFVQALTARLRQKRDYELVQTWMSVFLRCHSGEIVGRGKEMKALTEALKEWREEQGKEGKRLGELVGYCSGVLSWLKSHLEFILLDTDIFESTVDSHLASYILQLMGIPRLAGHLRPYSINLTLGQKSHSDNTSSDNRSPCSSSIVIDGPGLAYHIYYRLLSNRSGPVSTFAAAPSYQEIGIGVTAYLAELEAHQLSRSPELINSCSRHIYFDGYLPTRKRDIRFARLESYLKNLVKFKNQYPKGLQVSEGTPRPTLDASELFTSSPSISPTLRGVPAPPFLVPAVLDVLANSRYASITEVVPGEADAYCASAAKGSGGLVLTGDSDMLVHDIGKDSAVVFFNHLEFKRIGESPEHDSMVTAEIFRPADIAQRLGLPNLQRLAYEVKADPTIGFSEANRRARQSSNNPTRLRDFLEEYEIDQPTFTVPVPSQRSNPLLDPRISELILQLSSTEDQGVRIYLPFLIDDPSRSSAWVVSSAIRYLTYNLLCSYIPNPLEEITEVSRKGFRILPSAIPLSPSSISNEVEALTSHMQETQEHAPALTPTLRYRTFALRETYRWYITSDRNPPSHSIIDRALTCEYAKSTMTWEDIHLEAQIQAVLYALRMMKQSVTYLLALRSNHSKAGPLKDLDEMLEDLHHDFPDTSNAQSSPPVPVTGDWDNDVKPKPDAQSSVTSNAWTGEPSGNGWDPESAAKDDSGSGYDPNPNPIDFERFYGEEYGRSVHLAIVDADGEHELEIPGTGGATTTPCKLQVMFNFDRDEQSHVELRAKFRRENATLAESEFQHIRLRFHKESLFDPKYPKFELVKTKDDPPPKLRANKIFQHHLKTGDLWMLNMQYDEVKVVHEGLYDKLDFTDDRKLECVRALRRVPETSIFRLYLHLRSHNASFQKTLELLKGKMAIEWGTKPFSEYIDKKSGRYVLQWGNEGFGPDVDSHKKRQPERLTFRNIQTWRLTHGYGIMRDASVELEQVERAIKWSMQASFVPMKGEEGELPKYYLAFVQCDDEQLLRHAYNVGDRGVFCFEAPDPDSQPEGWRYIIKPQLPLENCPGNLVFQIRRPRDNDFEPPSSDTPSNDAKTIEI
ncbi:MAG: hypothetical protein Q9181_004140 [Wetmoreana brouardii]